MKVKVWIYCFDQIVIKLQLVWYFPQICQYCTFCYWQIRLDIGKLLQTQNMFSFQTLSNIWINVSDMSTISFISWVKNCTISFWQTRLDIGKVLQTQSMLAFQILSNIWINMFMISFISQVKCCTFRYWQMWQMSLNSVSITWPCWLEILVLNVAHKFYQISHEGFYLEG